MLVFDNSKKVEKKVVGFLKGESLAFKATYFIVCFWDKAVLCQRTRTLFSLKNNEITLEINSYEKLPSLKAKLENWVSQKYFHVG